MSPIILRAHFDGKQIILDESIKLKPNTKLIVTILSEDEGGEQSREEREAWLRMSQKGLGKAYGENETEYSLNMIKEPNPQYEGR